jgi:hypothetical protein
MGGWGGHRCVKTEAAVASPGGSVGVIRLKPGEGAAVAGEAVEEEAAVEVASLPVPAAGTLETAILAGDPDPSCDPSLEALELPSLLKAWKREGKP